MATESETPEHLRRQDGIDWKAIKNTLFEAGLLAATLIGIVALLVLFGYIAFDAFRPLAASARWYLLYFGVLVAPVSAFTLYVRRTPVVRAVNAKAYGVVFGSVSLGLVSFVVADSVDPLDILVYFLFITVPVGLVIAYDYRSDQSTYTGPAIPVALVGGLAAGFVLFDFVRPIIGLAADWMAYMLITTVPVLGVVGVIAARRHSRRVSYQVVTAGLIGAILLSAGLRITGTDPSFWLVMYSMSVFPVGYTVVDTVITNRDGRIGLLGPFVLIGGLLFGATLERQFGITGLDSYLSPTLLLESWHGLDATQAGVFPQIVGSILIVGVMAVLAFPVGIGAAVYLEEYAPNSGWKGRFASILEVNISNLAGVPSVVYGLLGLALFRNTLGFGTGIVLSAAGTLGLLILPIVIVSAQEALRAVPDSLRQASYGMGASRWQTIRNVVFPEAVPGMLTGTILALARAIGETAPLVIIAVATTTYSPPSGILSSATALPLQIFAARSNFDAAFRHGIVPATAVVLLVLMLVMNATAVVIRNRYQRE